MTSNLAEWLKAHELEEYLPVFVENAVDFKTLQVLTDADLKELGLPFGPRKRILNALANPTRPAAPPVPPPAPVVPTGERRQLTVLFCDMVGFTNLASRLDPEVLQSVIQTYERVCTECVTRFGGYMFQRLGDGIVAFFGVPLAHEGEAERAIRAGLLIIEKLGELDVSSVGRIEVRVGIATGVVVVSLSDNSAVGETMNLAARLQALADSGSIVVSEQVRRMAGRAFNYADLGERSLKGITKPTHVFRVVNASAIASRFEAATGDHLTPLVGRDHEVEVLLARWTLAREGKGQVALLAGEPGIGKSRIVSALRGRLHAEGVAPLLFQCSPYHANSAFYPIIDHLERALRFQPGDSAATKLDKLEALVVQQRGCALEHVRFLAVMLSIPCEDRYGSLALTPKRHKEKTLTALIELLGATVQTQPGLLLFEDLHWADPTTLEVLDLVVERVKSMPMLVVLTHRPEFQPPWHDEHIVSISLGRLTPAQSGTLVSRLTGGKAFPPELMEQILAKTDGVPLFVEELTKSILELGTLKEEGGRYAFADSSADMALPATLRDLLMARLDRVKEVKEVAQIGAAIGRDFSYRLMEAVSPLNKPALDNGLRQLTASGLAFQRGVIPDATFTFKHALVQDAAYDSLLKSRRRELHGMIARAIEQLFPGTRETEPELLAHHYSEAGQTEPAVAFWRQAGELALRRFALREAGTHLRRGLGLVGTLPAGPERDRQELGLRTLLGPAVVARRGWAAAEVSGILEPALKLVKALQHQKSYLPVLHGLWVHTLTSARLAESKNWAHEILATAEATRDSDLEISGHRAAMTSHFWLGDLAVARQHGEIIRARYDAQRHWHIAIVTNSDPLTGDGIYGSQYLWMLGYPDRARDLALANHQHARARNHPFDLAFALTLGAQVFEFRGEPHELLRHAAEGERVGREHGVPVMSDVLAEISKGIAWLGDGRVRESIPQLREAIARLHQTGQLIWAPYLRARLGEAIAREGDPAAGLALIEESLAQIERQDERSHLAEVLRLKGVVLLAAGERTAAEAALRGALAFAQQQQAKSWELRAAIALARLLAARGDAAAGVDVLAPVYDWFTEGFATRDLQEAAVLLDTLRSSRRAVPQPA